MQFKVSRRMLFTWSMLAGLIFLLTPQDLTNKFQFAFAHIFRWPLSVSRSISLSARSSPSIQEFFRHKEALYQNHITNLMSQLDQTHDQVVKLTKTRTRLPLEGAKLVPASVITANIGDSQNEFIINRGQYDEIQVGMFVIGDNSIIGSVSEVSSRTAKIKLITDIKSKIPVKIDSIKTNLLMQGAGNAIAKITLVKYQAKKYKNVIALKVPGFLEIPMITGKVTDCTRNDENPLLWDIMVEPACKIENIKDVAVIIVNPK